MGKCCSKAQDPRPQGEEQHAHPPHKKQNKNIDDRKMLKVGIDIMNKDFSVQIGYNRKAVKTYTDVQPAPQQEQNS